MIGSTTERIRRHLVGLNMCPRIPSPPSSLGPTGCVAQAKLTGQEGVKR